MGSLYAVIRENEQYWEYNVDRSLQMNS
jgi:hypothetical protein